MNIHSENSNIGIRHLRAVLAIAAERSFVAAALRLSVAPSALTETIKQIETATGVLLFDRKTKPVRPTQAGSEFILECEHIVMRHDLALARLREIGGLERGNITIGVSPSLVDRVLGPAIAEFAIAHPQIRITVIDEIGGRIEALVMDHKADFGLTSLRGKNAELHAEEIGQDPFGLVCHSSHPLAKGRNVAIEAIDPDEIIALSAETGTARMLAEEPAIPRALLDGRLSAHSTISLLLMVRQKLGVAILPQFAASVLGTSELSFVPFRDVSLNRKLHILTRPFGSLSPAADALIDIIRKQGACAL